MTASGLIDAFCDLSALWSRWDGYLKALGEDPSEVARRLRELAGEGLCLAGPALQRVN